MRLLGVVISLVLFTCLVTASVYAQEAKVSELNAEVARLYEAGRYPDAEAKAKEYVALAEKTYGENHIEFATAISWLAHIYRAQSRYAEAEMLIKRDLNISEKIYGPNDVRVASSLNMLAELYRTQRRYKEAEPLYKRSLKIREKTLPPDHSELGDSLNNIALLYKVQRQYSKAEPLLKRAIEIYKKAHGPEHPYVGTSLHNLAMLHFDQRQYKEAETLCKRALKIREKAYDPKHPMVGAIYHSLATIYDSDGRHAEAEPLYLRSLKITELALGPDHPDVGQTLTNLAELYEDLKRYEDEAKMRARLANMPPRGTRHVSLYFVTNREKAGTGFNAETAASTSLGRIVMSVPEDQVKNRAERIGESLGQLEKAKSGDLTAADKLKIVRIRHLTTSKQFAASVRASQTRSANFKNQALVFVHGFNNDFSGAIKRATQLSFDLQFDGINMPFIWPSQGKVSSYLSDAKIAANSVDPLVAFLDQLHQSLPELKIHVLAHSLGNRIMLNALCKIAKRGGDKQHNFGQVIAAHADVSHAEFEKLTSCFKDRVEGITLYVNEKDTALRVRCVWVFKCRAGNYARGYKNSDVIVTTEMSSGFFRTLSKGFDHDIFVRNPLLFSDIFRLILTGQRPVDKRTQEFRPIKGPKGNVYFAYDKSYDPAAQPVEVSKN